MDFWRLSHALNKMDWPRCYGISAEEWEERRKYGVSIVNPLIETLDELIETGNIKQTIDYRREGCTAKTPRFLYSLN